MTNLFRTVVRDAETHETQIVLLESRDFGKCLRAARRAINDGAATVGQIDILVLNQVELWASIWEGGEI